MPAEIAGGMKLDISAAEIPDAQSVMRISVPHGQNGEVRRYSLNHLALILLAIARQRADGCLTAPLNMTGNTSDRVAAEIDMLVAMKLAEAGGTGAARINDAGRAVLAALESEEQR